MILRLTNAAQPGAALGTALYLRGIASVLVFVVAALIAIFLKYDDSVALNTTLIVSLCIIAYALNTLDFWFKANTSPAAPAFARTSATLISICAKVVVLLLGLGVVALAWTVTLEAVISGVGLFIAYKWSTNDSLKDRLTVNLSQIRPILKESMPYLFSSVALLMYMKVDVVMLGYLSTNKETGIYSLAQKLSEVLYMVPVVLIDSAYPILARKFLDSDSNDMNPGQMLFDIAVGGAIISLVVALVLVKPAVNILFGKEYASAVEVFNIHGWSCVAIAMNTARHRWLAIINLQRYIPLVTVIGLISNVALNFVLIPSHAATGAAVATVVSYFLSGYLTSFLIPELRFTGHMQTRSLWPWFRLNSTFRKWRS